MSLQLDAKPPAAAGVLHGAKIIREIKASGIEFIPCLPDIHTSEGLMRPLASDTELKLIRVCKEDEGIGICAGLSYCDKRALLLMQYSGMLDSINALRIVGVEYSLPICMMVGSCTLPCTPWQPTRKIRSGVSPVAFSKSFATG